MEPQGLQWRRCSSDGNEEIISFGYATFALVKADVAQLSSTVLLLPSLGRLLSRLVAEEFDSPEFMSNLI